MILRAYAETVRQSPEALAGLLDASIKPATREVGHGIKISGLRDAMEKLSTEYSGTDLDSKLVRAVHEALPITRREALQPNVWNWLCVEVFLDLAWERWADGVSLPADPVERGRLVGPDGGSHALSGRLLASPSLRGLGRNAMSRLWWAGEVLHEGDDYDLAEKAINRSQLWVDLFERRLGLHVPLARIFVEKLESLQYDDLVRLVDESIDLARKFPKPEE